jgi:hypothetical protein
MMSTISNAGFGSVNKSQYQAPVATGSVGKVAEQVGQIAGDAMKFKHPVMPIDVLFKPSTKQLEANVNTATGKVWAAQQQVNEAQKDLLTARSPLERMIASRALADAKAGLSEAKSDLAHAKLALAERHLDEADDAVRDAEQAVQNASNPLSRMFAMKQLEAAVKAQVKAQDGVDKARQEVWSTDVPVIVHPPIWLEHDNIDDVLRKHADTIRPTAN